VLYLLSNSALFDGRFWIRIFKKDFSVVAAIIAQQFVRFFVGVC